MKKQTCIALLTGISMLASLTACGSSAQPAATTAAPAATQAPAATTAAPQETKAPEAAPAKAEAAPASEGGKYANWPEKDITIYVNSKAGSSGDTMTRQFAEAANQMDIMNGHKILVNNVIDTTGYQTWKPVSEAAGDGYLLACMSTVAPSEFATGVSELDYHDLTYISGYFVDPQFLYCKAEEPYNDMAECVQYMKDHPGELNWGSGSATGPDSIALAVFLKNNPDVQINRVSYSGGADLQTAILGGFVNVGVTEYLDIAPQLEAGALKILGVMSEERVKDLPDVKTWKECGENIVMERARGFAGPKDMDPELVKRINEVFKPVWESESFQKWMTDNRVDIRWMEGDEFLASYTTIYDYTVQNLADLTG